jgi:hypothetical protein
METRDRAPLQPSFSLMPNCRIGIDSRFNGGSPLRYARNIGSDAVRKAMPAPR